MTGRKRVRSSAERVGVVDWRAVVVEGVTYYWTAYPAHCRTEGGLVVPCVALSVVLEPDAGGGVAATFPSEKTVTEVDAIELVRAFHAAGRGPFPGSPRESTSLVPYTFAATYEDSLGQEAIEVRVVPRTMGKNTHSSFGFETCIRGVVFSGAALDTLSPVDSSAARARGFPDDALQDFVLAGELPCAVMIAGVRQHAPLRFELEVRRGSDSKLTLRLTVLGESHEVVDEWFEDALLRLDRSLPQGSRVVACVTCQFSDYSPYGHGLMGMSCHRGVKEQYLAVRTKGDYFAVPTTEEVMETHLCDEWESRVPGTGYRG